MMIKNAIYCFDDTVSIWDLISQSWEIHEMMWSDWFGWSRVAGAKSYSNVACVLLKYSCLSLLGCQSTKSRRCLNGDSGINWRHGMLSDIIYAYIKKGVMFDSLDMTLLLNNKSLNNRFWWYRKTEFERIFWTSNEFKSFKNNMFEVLSNRILLGREIKDFV